MSYMLQNAKKRLHHGSAAQKGFTLIELIVVLVILTFIGILVIGGFVACGLVSCDSQESKRNRAQSNALHWADSMELDFDARKVSCGDLDPYDGLTHCTVKGKDGTLTGIKCETTINGSCHLNAR